MKPIVLSLVVLCFAACVSAQSVPDLRFNGHALGETALTFFSTATMSDSKTLTKEHCKTVLNDPDAVKEYEAAKTSADKKAFLFSDIGGCQQVMAALRGERAPVGSRYASELGKGAVTFAAGKLVSFKLTIESPYSVVVADMTRRFGISGQDYAGKLKPGSKAMHWNVDGVSALVVQLQYQDHANILVAYSR